MRYEYKDLTEQRTIPLSELVKWEVFLMREDPKMYMVLGPEEGKILTFCLDNDRLTYHPAIAPVVRVGIVDSLIIDRSS